MTTEERARGVVVRWLSEPLDAYSLRNAIMVTIREAVAAEREACAQLAESVVLEFFGNRLPAKPTIAAAIRARANP